MPESILLSIIIPNFNSGKLLEVTLQSIFKEKNLLNFEVLVMDNCSLDNPEKIINKFEFEHLYFYSEPDSGIYDAMNKGVMKAKGNWFHFLGAGDEFLPYMTDLSLFFDSDYMMIYGNVFLVQSNRMYDGEFNFFKLLKRNISHQGIFYKKEIFSKIGLFETKYRIAADYVLNLKLFFSERRQIKYQNIHVSNFLGMGISDKQRDDLFQENKLFIINKMLISYPSIFNIITVLNYDFFYFRNYLRFKWSKWSA